jgi:hypothetical protein
MTQTCRYSYSLRIEARNSPWNSESGTSWSVHLRRTNSAAFALAQYLTHTCMFPPFRGPPLSIPRFHSPRE